MNRLSSQPVASDQECLSRDRLRQYLAGFSEEDAALDIETHLGNCSACEATLAEIEQECGVQLFPHRNGKKPEIEEDPIISQALESAKLQSADEATRSPRVSRSQSEVERASAMPNPGELGPYQLIHPLGRGGMGMVYLAKHRKLNKRVAIKILPTAFVGAEASARFEREILAAGQLKHPSLVLATDAGQVEGIQYLVMEYIDGFDLSRLARAVPSLSIPDVCEIGRQMALGLSSAHAAGMVHRDIKPSNVMLDGNGSIKLLDFGLVLLDRWDGVSSELTTIGQFLGTLDYMAPEQAERCSAVDYRSDLYSLGATLFRLLCGRAPLAAAPNQSPLEKLRLLANHRPPSLKTVRSDSPEELVQLVDQLLSTQPNARPPSAAHVAEKLADLAKQGDLNELLVKARQAEENLPEDHSRSSMMPSAAIPMPLVSNSNRDNNSHRRWLAAAAGFLAIIFAGYWIVLETSKGQLVIDSEVSDVQVRVLRDGQPVRDLNIQHGNASTRLTADRYEVILQSPSDNLSIENNQFTLKSGETIVARIRTQVASPARSVLDPLEPSSDLAAVVGTGPTSSTKVDPKASEIPTERNEPIPVYKGKFFGEWLAIMKTERSIDVWEPACKAALVLLTHEKMDEFDEVMFDVIQFNHVERDYPIAQLASRPEKNLSRLMTILESDLTRHNRDVGRLVNQAIHRDAPVWDPFWKWIEKLVSTTGDQKPLDELTTSEVAIQSILSNLNDTQSSLGSYRKTDTNLISEKRTRFVERLLPLMDRSNRIRNYAFSDVTDIADNTLPSEHQEALIRHAVQLIDEDVCTSDHVLAILNFLEKTDRFKSIPVSKLNLIVSRKLTLVRDADPKETIRDPSSHKLVESEMDIGMPYTFRDSAVNSKQIRMDGNPVRLLVPSLLRFVPKLEFDKQLETALQGIADATADGHKSFSRQFDQLVGSADGKFRFFIDPLSFAIVIGDGSLSRGRISTKLDFDFIVHRWVQKLLGKPLPDPLASSSREVEGTLKVSDGGTVQPPSDPQPSSNSKSPTKKESLYKGKSFDEWLRQLRLEKDSVAWMEAFEAVDHEMPWGQDRELSSEVFTLAIDRQALAKPEFCEAFTGWTSRAEFAQMIIEHFEKQTNKLETFLSQLATPINVLQVSDETWDPIWKRLDTIQSGVDSAKRIDDKTVQSFFTKMVEIPGTRQDVPKSKPIISKALHVLEAYPKLGKRYLLVDVLINLKRVSTLATAGDPIRVWATDSLDSLLPAKLGVIEDPKADLATRVKLVELISRNDLASDDNLKRFVQAVDDLLVTPSKDHGFLFGTFDQRRSTSSTRESARKQSIQMEAGKKPTAFAQLHSDKVFATLLSFVERIPEEKRSKTGLDAIIESTRAIHDQVRTEWLEQLGVEDLSRLSLTRGGIESGTISSSRANQPFASANIRAETIPLVEVYCCHRWANDLRGTPVEPIPAARVEASSALPSAKNVLPDRKPFDRSGLSPDAEKRWVEYCELKIRSVDKNNDQVLTEDEWPASFGDFRSVDIDRDGKINLREYYDYKKNR